jgi:hypothetical protein
MRFCKAFVSVPFLSGNVLCLSLLTLLIPPLRAQEGTKPPDGLAWHVQGIWQAEGKGAPILTGDPAQPGSLLQPSEEAANDGSNGEGVLRRRLDQ